MADTPTKRTDKHTETHTCDYISRQAAIDSIMEEPSEARYPVYYAEKIRQLPSAQPRKKGKWIYKHNIYGVAYCSECDFELHINDTPYCPNCCAEMERSDNED